MRVLQSIHARLRLGLASQVIGLVIFTALVAGGLVGVMLIQNSYTITREGILQKNLATADLVARFAAHYIEGVETNLRQFAARPLFIRAVRENDLEAELHLAQFLEIDERFESISVYDATGIGWASGLKDQWQNRGGTVADREWFQQIIATRKPYLGIPVISRATGNPVSGYAVLLFDDKGEIHAVLGGGISLAALSEATTELSISTAARTSLMDARQGGLIVAHPDPKRILAPVTGQNAAALRAVAGERGTMETRSSSGELTLAAFAPVPRLPWSVLIQEPSASAFAPLQNLTTQAIVYVSGIMLIAALLGIALARRIVRPVRELARGTEEIGKGNLDYQIEITSADEIGQLAQSFNRMTRDLRAITASRDELNREIAERKQAEEKLQIFAAELERSNKELEQFAYIASHDLQEPLRMVASYSQLLEKRYRGKLDQDANEYIGFAVDGVNRMQRLINDLLAYSRISTRGKEFTPVDCHAVVGQVIANLQIAIQETGALVTCDPLPTVRADESQMIQLFQNLIGNAIKFHGTEPPRVHISARETFEVLETSKVWTFSIRDNGIGIAPQYRERIFVIFQRLHTREEYSGTGIGLAICKKIVERHNGRIWVESEPGKGATFYFTLPAN